MKKQKKVILATLPVLFSFLLANQSVYADSANNPNKPNVFFHQVFYEDTLKVDTFNERFKYFDLLSSTISVKSLGRAVCTSTALIDSSYQNQLVMTLQKSNNGKDWTNIKSWNGVNPELTGDVSICLENSYYLTKGYTYRLITTINVYNGNRLLESSGMYSNEVYY